MSSPSRIISFLIVLIFVTSVIFFIQAKEIISTGFELRKSNLEVSQDSFSQNIPFAREKKGQETIIGEAKIVDQYLISGLPEDEFLNKYYFLKSGFSNVEISIESDKPLFKQENFYRAPSLLDKIKSFAGSESLPEHRIVKGITEKDELLETEIKIPGVSFKTRYEKKEDNSVKQELFFENNSNEEVTIILQLTHLLNVSHLYLDGKSYSISDKPRLVSSGQNSSVTLISLTGQRFIYDFYDLLDYNPGVWIFEKDSEKKMLVEITFSIPAKSSLVIDPVYTVDTTSALGDAAHSFQRKTWWDGSRYWTSFLSSGDNRLEFHYSSDGSSWTENTDARRASSMSEGDFSLECDSSDCFIAFWHNNTIGASQATDYPATDFSWGSDYVVFSAGGMGSRYDYCYIKKSPTDHIWVSAKLSQAFSLDYFYIRRSSSTNDVSQWNTSTILETNVGNNTYGVIVPIRDPLTQPKDEIMAIWKNGTKIKYKSYVNSTWSSLTSLASTTNSLLYNMSAVSFAQGTVNTVGLLYSRDESVYFRVGTSSSLSSEITLGVGNRTNIEYVTLSHDRENAKLYAFWIEYDGREIYSLFYREGSSPYSSTSDWGSETTVHTTSGRDLVYPSSNYSDSERVFIQFAQDGSSKLIRFANIIEPEPNSSPTIGTITLNGGENINLTSGVTTTVSSTATITDSDGYSDIIKLENVLYWSEVANEEGCTYNANTCYTAEVCSCATSSCSGNSCNLTCNCDVWFHATPTKNFTPKWISWIQIEDSADNSDAGTTSQDIESLYAFSITGTIDYGELDPGERMNNLTESNLITNTGNGSIDAYLYSTDMESSGNFIPVDYQQYATSSVSYGDGVKATSSQINWIELDLPKPTENPSNSTDTVYWGIMIPDTQAAGVYNGTTTYEPKPD